LIPKDFERSSSIYNNLKLKEEIDEANISIKQPYSASQPIQPNTSNSSRKSSISEFGIFAGTPPSNYLISRNILDKYEDENNDYRMNSISFNMNSHSLLRSSSALLVGHEFLKRHPKCFGAKFSGLPGILFFYLCFIKFL
jgi:hypothetical protein